MHDYIGQTKIKEKPIHESQQMYSMSLKKAEQEENLPQIQKTKNQDNLVPKGFKKVSSTWSVRRKQSHQL